MDAKRLLRSRLLAARAARTPEEIEAAGRSITEHAIAAWAGARRVATYAGVGTEPPTRAVIDALHQAGVVVLLPLIGGAELLWAPYEGWGSLVAGPHGLLQPPAAPVGSDVLDAFDVVIVPALAVDRRGNRLGRGAGYFDRALARISPAQIAAVVYDDEVLDEVPVEPHDR